MEKNSLFIVGGGTGLIGSHLVHRFSQLADHTVCLDRNPTQTKEDRVTYFESDLTQEEAVKKCFTEIFANKTYEHCVLINTQGIADPHSGTFAELSLKQWQKYIDTNLTSYFLTCREFIRYKSHFKSGAIINLSSTRHLMAEKDTEAYCASKGAITSLTQALAISLSNTGISANNVSPGWIDSPKSRHSEQDHHQHPSGRVGCPEDIFKVCKYLAEPDSFVTGQDFVVDGGMTRKMIYD